MVAFITHSMSDVQRSASGYQGFWIAMSGSICLVFWWILFTVWFCNKRVARAEFAGAASHNIQSNDSAQQALTVGNDSDDEDIQHL